MKYSLQEALRELRNSKKSLKEDTDNSRVKYHEGNTDYKIIRNNNLRIFDDNWCKVYNDRTVEFLKDLANNIPSDLTVLAIGEHHNFGSGNGNNNNVFIVVLSKNLYPDDELNSNRVPLTLIGFTGNSDWFKPDSNIVRDIFSVNENNLNDIKIIKTTNMQRYFGPNQYHAYNKYYPEIFKLNVSSAKDLAKFIDTEREKGYYDKYKLGKSNNYYDAPGKYGNLVYDVKMDD